MAFIGNTVQTQGFTPAIDYFNGNGVTVTFTLSRPVASVAQMIVAIDNVIQNPSSSFTVAGNAITFTSAPLSGTNNIWVEYTSLITTYNAISQDPTVIGDITTNGGGFLSTGDFGNSYLSGAILDYVTGMGRVTVGPSEGVTFYNGGTASRVAMGTFDTTGNFTNNATGYTKIARGTTGQRPGTPTSGMTRFNTSTNYMEYYNGFTWEAITAPYQVEYLVIAGGGGGTISNFATGGGAGGAGGYRSSVLGESSGGGFNSESPLNLIVGTSYTATVGAGGANQTNGSNSAFSTITSIGGGRGSGYNQNAASSGGSGGGGAYNAQPPGSGTSGQGYSGGYSDIGGGGGGGGAGSIGGNGSNSRIGGNGGAGVTSSITGTPIARAGGGGGGATVNYASPAVGGTATAGGGNGGSNTAGSPGSANTGGGGGGPLGDTIALGGAGGSGVVILRYFGSQRGTGGTVTSSGGYTIHTFTSSGTYTA